MEKGEAPTSFTEEELAIPCIKYEYLDHTADVQLHAWGENLEESFEQCAMAMFGYMTELEYVEIKESHEIVAEGHDMLSLLFHFLDEFLFLFCAEPFLIAKKVQILEFDRANWRIRAKGYGEPFEIGKHPQGTEVKAITYSNMQVHEDGEGGKCEWNHNKVEPSPWTVLPEENRYGNDPETVLGSTRKGISFTGLENAM